MVEAHIINCDYSPLRFVSRGGGGGGGSSQMCVESGETLEEPAIWIGRGCQAVR